VNTPEVKVITSIILPYFILPEAPLHKAFPYITPMGQGDYFRMYFLHYYGGGYTDMKHLDYDFLPYFKKLEDSPDDMYAIGYH
jgi:hypothetical protein